MPNPSKSGYARYTYANPNLKSANVNTWPPEMCSWLPLGLQSLLCILLPLELDFFHLTCRLIVFFIAIAANRAHIIIVI